jgi:DNA repair ATPase RecN
MNRRFLSVSSVERRLVTGNTETLTFKAGVNLLVGRPNTGKTRWLQTLDFLLGDTGENPFEGASETGLAEKYDAAAAVLLIDGKEVHVERRWRETGAKSKVFLEGKALSTRDFQHELMELLGLPLLSFPKGNPMSGQTWPELSFRMLLRHIYRQQRFWSGIADLQPDAEQHACILQFLGLAERIYTDEYGELIAYKAKAERLRSRREQYSQTLDDLAKELIADPGMTVSVTRSSIKAARGRLMEEIRQLGEKRSAVLIKATDSVPEFRGHLADLASRRADLLVGLEEDRRRLKATEDRTVEMNQYHRDIVDELNRVDRTRDAGVILADLKITHCPACDQAVTQKESHASQCFLCDQQLPEGPVLEGLGAVRLRFESDRLNGELQEADDLLSLLKRERKRYEDGVRHKEQQLQMIERELEPARDAVSALAQQEVSGIDFALGQATERERQLARIDDAFDLSSNLEEQIRQLEKQIEPLQDRVDAVLEKVDFDESAELLQDGMNDYLNALNLLRPGVWRHNAVQINVSRTSMNFRVGNRRWNTVLGGTDTLYFLMAYHYGLLSLSDKAGCHYPGFAVIDLPGEFSGEAVEDKENFIVQPFIDLLAREGFEGTQLIMTGAAFTGLEGASIRKLTHVFAA